MRVVRVRTGRRIAPWDEPVGALRVVGVPIADRQERAARACGLTWAGEADEAGSDPDTLWWDDDVDLSIPALSHFLKAGRGKGRLALVERPAGRAQLDADLPGPTWEGEPTRVHQVGRGDPVVVPPAGFGGVARLPMGVQVPWFLSARTAVTVRHWTHLLRANLAAAPVAIGDALLMRPWNLAWTWLRSPLRAGAGRLAAVGRGCDIHPTARLEGCVLGRGVRVGAYSVLRGCVVGDEAIVEDHVTARGSVIGDGAHLANYAMFNLSVLGRGSSIGHIGAQASILGDGSFVASFAVLQDLNFAGTVRVRDGDVLVDSGTPFLGVAVGHRSRIASTLVIPPGRAVPNDVELHVDPEFRVADVPPGLSPGRYVVRNRKVEPA